MSANPRKDLFRERIDAEMTAERSTPRKRRQEPLSEIDQIATATIDGDVVHIHSKRIDGLVYAVTAKGCHCAGFVSHRHCYHEGVRKVVLWLSHWIERECLTFAQAIANLRAARERGACGAIDCGFCRRNDLCPRTSRREDWRAVQATAA
jgi:hypothetical protein